MGRLAVLVSVVMLAGCGGSSGQAPTTDQPSDTSRCVDVSAAKLAAIEAGLTIDGGGGLGSAAAVRSSDYSRVYFVSAVLVGPGLGGDTIGTWATNRLGEGGMIFSVDGTAKEFSEWGDAGGRFSAFDDGAQESKDCVR